MGFKMTRGQDERVLEAMLDDHAVRKIVLRRRNVLRTYVSEMIANQTGLWEVYDRFALRTIPPRVRVDVGELRNHLRVNAVFYDRLEQTLRFSRQSFLEAWYEQLFEPDAHTRLLHFLDVSPGMWSLSSKSVKQNSGDLRRLISNYAELESALAGSELEWLLHAEEIHAYGREVSGNA
jgi:hypothetical protein